MAELLDLNTPVVDVLTQYGGGLGSSIPWDFLIVGLVKLSAPPLTKKTLWIWRSIGSIDARTLWWPLIFLLLGIALVSYGIDLGGDLLGGRV